MIDLKRLERYLKDSLFTVERVGDESFVLYRFFILRLPTANLPEWLRSVAVDMSVCDAWQMFLVKPAVSKLQLTERFDLVEKSKYCVLLDEASHVHWLAHELLSLIEKHASARYELLNQHAVRMTAGGQIVAFIAERVDPEVEREKSAQRMAERQARIREAYLREEEAERGA